jgi:hypothetical protein
MGEVRSVSKQFEANAIATGEPLVSMFSPDEFAYVLADNGFQMSEDVGAEEVEARYGTPALAVCNERIAYGHSH